MYVYSSPLRGTENDRSLQPVQAIRPASPADGGASPPFGEAYVRHQSPAQDAASDLYGSDARMIKSLEQRDREVRQNEEAKGEAVGGDPYVYQTGPDGRRYAIGTTPHAVRREEENGTETGASGNAAVDAAGEKMSREDKELLQKLQARDAEVRGHEATHIMAAGGKAGMPSYSYQTGPDGRRYAIGGSVNISATTTGDPEHDAREARRVQRAAMATGDPSTKDMQAAMRATTLKDRAAMRAIDQYTREEAPLRGEGIIV